MTGQGHTVHDGAAPAGSAGLQAPPERQGSTHAARNRRLGWILFGIFAAIAIFSIVFIDLRSVGR